MPDTDNPGPPDGGTPDGGTPDAGTPEGGTPDGGTPEGGTPEGGTQGGTPDAGTPDGGTPDAGTPDAGIPPLVMGFDWGTQTIGVAIGQTLTRTATPLPVVKTIGRRPDWSCLLAMVDDWRPGLLLVGIPLNMDDSESESSRLARKFGASLSSRTGIPWEGMDERLSTFEARERVPAGVAVDSLAAKLIVESYFSQLA